MAATSDMRFFLFIAFIIPMCFKAQDKLFFRDGTSRKGYLMSVSKEFVYFKASDTSVAEKISKSKLALIEDYKGRRYLFSETYTEQSVTSEIPNGKEVAVSEHRNIITFQPMGLIFGRATFNYERLSKDEKIGVSIPFALTFDPSGVLYNSDLDTNKNALPKIKGVSYITGADIHFYIGRHERPKFFIGPRFRYGTDLFLRKSSGYSLQTELGWIVTPRDMGKGYTQSFSVGFGFVRLITAPNGILVDPKQSYGWFSVSYKLGVKW